MNSKSNSQNHLELKHLLDTFYDNLSVEASHLFNFMICHQELYTQLEKYLSSEKPELKKSIETLLQQNEYFSQVLSDENSQAIHELGTGLTNLGKHILYKTSPTPVSDSTDSGTSI